MRKTKWGQCIRQDFYCFQMPTPQLKSSTLDPFDPEEVTYVAFNVTAPSGRSVRLDCGGGDDDPPSVFIWGFTRSGSDSSVALACDYGGGAVLQPQPDGALRVHVPANSSSLVVEDVQQEAEGTYTCQALYRAGHRRRLIFYSTRLDMEDD
ncbi:V-set and immunoglobulin domain-containing protein 10-like 2 isoform X3 [Festucalex cinctus]